MSLLSTVTKSAPPLPSRVVIYAGEKFGKTSLGCFAPNAIFAMTAQETGLLSLIESRRVPPTAHFPDDFKEWGHLVGAIRELRDQDHAYKTLVIDTGNGAERLCCDYTCKADYKGDWGEYQSWGNQGDRTATIHWAEFLRLLDDVRIRRKMAILILHHARVKQFKDPAGKNFDQWKPEANEKLWALTHKWADVIAFGGFQVKVVKDKAAEEKRFLQTGASAAIVAGNRYGLPNQISAAEGAENLWKAFSGYLAKAKAKPDPNNNGKPPEPSPPAEVPPEPEAGSSPEPDPEPPAEPEPDVQVESPTPDAATQARVEKVMEALHSVKQQWTDPNCKVRLSTIIGRTIGADAAIGELSEGEAGKVIAYCADYRAKLNARKKPGSNGTAKPDPDKPPQTPAQQQTSVRAAEQAGANWPAKQLTRETMVAILAETERLGLSWPQTRAKFWASLGVADMSAISGVDSLSQQQGEVLLSILRVQPAAAGAAA